MSLYGKKSQVSQGLFKLLVYILKENADKIV